MGKTMHLEAAVPYRSPKEEDPLFDAGRVGTQQAFIHAGTLARSLVDIIGELSALHVPEAPSLESPREFEDVRGEHSRLASQLRQVAVFPTTFECASGAK